MNRVLTILLIVLTTGVYAQQQAPQQFHANCPGELPTSPYYYCQCRNNSVPFVFPLEEEIKDTLWYSAKLEDMKQGLAAYWFADCSVAFEVYAFCSSKVPTISMTVGKNQMREMSIEEINKKLDAMGEQAETLGQLLTPRIRVYPNDKGTGKVYCYPYDQGPVSTCENPLPVISGMTYVCDKDTEVYELVPERISAYGRGFIRWQQKKNQEGTVWLTEGSCDGPEIGRAVLSDSMRVFVLDSVKMKAAKEAGKNVYVHVAHDSSYVGRIMYRSSIHWNNRTIDTTLCQGKTLQLADTVLRATTVYPNDTLWVARDTLSLTTYNLTIEPPAPVYDTLRLKAAQLPRLYKNNYIPKNGWGDYDFTNHSTNKCDERYLLHVEHDSVRVEAMVDTTLCLGKTIRINNVTYSTDTLIRDSSWTDADTWTVSDITIRFAEPELEYDTIEVLPSQMTSRGYYYSELRAYVHYGDTLIVKTQRNTCTRKVQLHVGQDAVLIEGAIDTTLCMGNTIMFGEEVYSSDTMFYDTIQVDADTWMYGTISLHFEAPVPTYDTVTVSPVAMPEEGYLYAPSGAMVGYGDTLLVSTDAAGCEQWLMLHVAVDTTPILTTADTTLCLGKTVTVGEVTYAADTVVQDSVWMEPGVWLIHALTVHFESPQPEYDTISVSPGQQTAEGYWYEEAQAWVSEGDTLLEIAQEEQCTRWVWLHVASTEGIEHLSGEPEEHVYVYVYMREGVIYIRREGQDYDLLGRPVLR